MNEFNPFPLEQLPDSLRQMAVESAESIGCDPTYTVQPILAAAAWALGAGVVVRLKPGWTEPPILWLATVGSSGSAKTPAARPALRPVQDLQHEWMEGAGGLSLAGPLRRAIVGDITFEALAGLLYDNRHGLLLVCDELAAWLASFTRYKGSSDAARWLSLHSGDPLTVDRKTSEPRQLHIRRPILSIVGGIQPDILAGHMTNENRSSGLMPRLLLAMPPERHKGWHSDRFVSSATLEAYASAIRTVVLQVEGLESPVEVPLSETAMAKWARFYNKWNEELPDLHSDYLKSVWSKTEAYAARLSLIVGSFRRIEAGDNVSDDWELTKEDVESGTAIAKWFAREHRRVDQLLSGQVRHEDLQAHARWIRGRGGEVSVRDFQRERNLPRAGDAERVLMALANANYGQLIVRGSGPSGGRPSHRFVLEWNGE